MTTLLTNIELIQNARCIHCLSENSTGPLLGRARSPICMRCWQSTNNQFRDYNDEVYDSVLTDIGARSPFAPLSMRIVVAPIAALAIVFHDSVIVLTSSGYFPRVLRIAPRQVIDARLDSIVFSDTRLASVLNSRLDSVVFDAAQFRVSWSDSDNEHDPAVIVTCSTEHNIIGRVVDPPPFSEFQQIHFEFADRARYLPGHP